MRVLKLEIGVSLNFRCTKDITNIKGALSHNWVDVTIKTLKEIKNFL